MFFFRRPITILYVLFSIIVLSLAFQNCSSPFESIGNTNYSLDGSETLSAVEAKSLEIFEQTLFPTIQQNCASCHGTTQEPLFALAEPLDSHRALFARDYINLDSPESSFLAIKIRAGHNNFPVELADEFIKTIEFWSTNLNAATKPPAEEPPTEEPPADEPPAEEPPAEEPPAEEPPAEEPPAEEPPAEEPPTEEATFTKVNETILIPKCLNCHKPTSEGGLGLEDNYLTYETTIATGSVVASDSASSSMFVEVSSGKMPPGKALSDEEVTLIKSWIDGGAKNN